jgi:hypothetical protein
MHANVCSSENQNEDIRLMVYYLLTTTPLKADITKTTLIPGKQIWMLLKRRNITQFLRQMLQNKRSQTLYITDTVDYSSFTSKRVLVSSKHRQT